jgi:tetratricopeptide (TPR) repeat protein
VNPGEAAFIRGKAFNALEEYNIPADEWLTKAVKLDPSNTSAWVSLAQCTWKKGDLVQAKKFLLESLNHGETQEALQELSMITRQIRTKNEDPALSLEESISFAKRAIQVNFNDHKSWYVYGNAYVMRFFNLSQDVHDLKRSLAAYTKSISLGGDGNPDLFYNQGNVFRYLQDFESAMESYLRTITIDPAFTLAQDASSVIQSFLTRTRDMLEHRGWIKRKRFEKIVEDLRSSRHSSGCKSLRELNEGENIGIAIAVCILMPATKGEVPPECFLCVDIEGQCAILSIYNLSSDSPPPSQQQVFTISNPIYRPHIHTNRKREDSNSPLPPPPPPPPPLLSQLPPAAASSSGGIEVTITQQNNSIPVETTSSLSTGSLYPPLIQAYRLDSVKVDGRTISLRAAAPPQLRVSVFDS